MQIQLDPDDLRPIVESVVAELNAQFDADSDRLAYSEEDAAGLLGVPATTLRDERLRGRVEASMVGRKVRYTRAQLLAYLARRPWKPKE